MLANFLIIFGELISYHKEKSVGSFTIPAKIRGVMYNEISPASATSLLAELTAAAEAGALTEQQLSGATRSHAYHQGELFSAGLLWMRKNTKHLGALGFNLANFLVDHLDVTDFGSSLIHSRKVLEALPECDRTHVYWETFTRCGDRSSAWVRDAQQLGVSPRTIAEMILERLRQHKTCSATEIATPLQDFLRYGAGRIEQTNSDDPWNFRFADTKYTYWAVLTDEQLMEAVKITVESAPALLFEFIDSSYNSDLWLKLSMRLGGDTVQSLAAEAAYRLTSMSGVSARRLLQLPASVQLQVARNTGGSAELVVQAALAVGITSGGEALLAEFEHLFKNGGAVAAFASTHSMLRQTKDKASAARIKEWLIDQAAADGYIYGQVKLGAYFNTKLGRKMAQLQVKCQGPNHHIYYIQDRNQQGYSPMKGDWVFVEITAALQLAARTAAAPFTFAHK